MDSRAGLWARPLQKVSLRAISQDEQSYPETIDTFLNF